MNQKVEPSRMVLRPPLPPKWAFGHIKSKDEYVGADDVLADAKWLQENDVPTTVIHIDAPWQAGLNVFEFAKAKVLQSVLHPETVGLMYDFSTPGENPFDADPYDPLVRPRNNPPFYGQTLIDTLHDLGIHVTVWITPMINDGTSFGIGEFEHQAEYEAPLYAFVKGKGYVESESRAYHRGHGGRIDYSNPEAVDWWHRLMDKVLNMGVDGFVLDGGPDHIYVCDTFQHLRFRKGDEALMMSRSSPINIASTLLVWASDTRPDFSDKGIKYAVEQALKASENGTPFVSGTQSPRGEGVTPGFIAREIQFNAFCPVLFSFCYGLSNPWEYGNQATEVWKYYVRLHNELIPYTYSCAIRAHCTGKSIMQRTVGDLQYLFCDDFLVAPIYRDSEIRHVVFPSGRWIDYWNEDKVYEASREIDYYAPLECIPLFIRVGAIIPMEITKNWSGHGTSLSAGTLTLLIYPENTSMRWYFEKAGDTLFICEKMGNYETLGSLKFKINGLKRTYILRIKTFAKPKNVNSASVGPLTEVSGEDKLTPFVAGWCHKNEEKRTIIRLPKIDVDVVTLEY